MLSISDRGGNKPDEDQEDQAEVDDAIMKVLIGHDSRSKACTAIPVPQRGVDPDEYAVREPLRYLDFLGYQSLVVKTDQERALNAVINRVRQYRGADTQDNDRT